MSGKKKTEIWIHSYSAEGGLRHASKVHPRAFRSVDSKDQQYRRWLQELLRGAPESPLAMYIKCTRFVDLAKPEHREKALTPLPFVFLHYLVPQVCTPGTPCADPRTLVRQRLVFWIVSVLLLGLLAVPWLAPLFY